MQEVRISIGLLTFLGFTVTTLSAIFSHILTVYRMKGKFAQKKDITGEIKKCRETHEKEAQADRQEMTMVNGKLENIESQIKKGDKEFTVVRLLIGEIFEKIGIPRKKLLQIRDDVLNNRVTE